MYMYIYIYQIIPLTIYPTCVSYSVSKSTNLAPWSVLILQPSGDQLLIELGEAGLKQVVDSSASKVGDVEQMILTATPISPEVE